MVEFFFYFNLTSFSVEAIGSGKQPVPPAGTRFDCRLSTVIRQNSGNTFPSQPRFPLGKEVSSLIRLQVSETLMRIIHSFPEGTRLHASSRSTKKVKRRSGILVGALRDQLPSQELVRCASSARNQHGSIPAFRPISCTPFSNTFAYTLPGTLGTVMSL